MEQNKRWLNQYPEEIPHSIPYKEIALHQVLKETVDKYGDKKATHFFGKELTYKELYSSVRKFAQALKSYGIQKGDRVAIMLPNCPQAIISYYGVLMAGGVVVQTNPLYVERELEHQMVDSGARLIICLELLYPRVMKVKANTSLEAVIVTAIKDALPFPKNLIYPTIQKRRTGMKVDVRYDETTLSYNSFLAGGKDEEMAISFSPKEDLALLQYTGGTTGVAKGVMLTHHNLVANTSQCRLWNYQLQSSEERTLAALPFFHVYGMTVCMNLAIMNGQMLFIVPKFEPSDILKMIQKHKITIFPGAPTMYIGLINHPDINRYDLSSIKSCISGSAALPIEVQQRFEQLTGGKLVEGYGLTEAAPVTHCNLIWGKRIQGSIGLPWPDTEAMIIDGETGGSAPVGTIGELAIRGPQVMKGYWNREEDTAKTFHNGWLLTGDMAHMDENGYFYIVDRKKDMIIAGGFNIYPREIEEVLYEHEAVQEAVAIGIPDPYRGETVKVFVVLKEGKVLTENELNAYCRKHLAAFKVPRYYEFRNELPKTMIGKILRRVLVEEEAEKAKKYDNKQTS